MRTTRDPTPNARLRLQPILWVTWAGVCVLALCCAGIYLSGVLKVPQTHSFVGTLKPNQTPTKLKLPAGVPLKSMLVQAGEKVRAGQTVAVLDQAAMRAELEHIERSIAVAHVLRSCLLDPSEAATDAVSDNDIQKPQSGVHAELQVLIKAAKADCATGLRADNLKRMRLERGLELLQERLILINQKLAMVLGVNAENEKKGVHPVLRAHASVSIALERNELLQKLQVVKDELDALRVSQDQARLSRVAYLSKDVALNLKHQAVLQTYLENPRLTVPEKGMIGRVRPVPAGTQFEEDQTILEVHSEAEAQYVANLRVPLAQVDAMPIGTEVHVSLAGFTKRGPKLQGVIDHWIEGDSETGVHFAMARIRLTDQSQMTLSDPKNGIALRGTSTASVIRAELEPKSLKATLEHSVLRKADWAKTFFASLGSG